ncbi:hypothetical protein [Micromonospora zhanjiangensis]
MGISPDLGDRYVQTIYDDVWVTERFGAACLIPATDDQPRLSPLRS